MMRIDETFTRTTSMLRRVGWNFYPTRTNFFTGHDDLFGEHAVVQSHRQAVSVIGEGEG